MTVAYEYNNLDHVTREKYPDGTSVTYDYTCCGLPGIVTDRAGRKTYYDYDPMKRLARVQDAKGDTQNFMKMKTLQLYFLVTALMVSVLPLCAADAPIAKASGFVQGQRAPSINIVDADGKRRILANMRFEKRVLLTFFPKCFTGTCTTQLTSLRDSYAELQKQDVEVWAISTDAAEGEKGQRAFAKELKLPFPLLPDVERKISLAYGAVQSKDQMAARMSVLVSKRGTIEWVDKQIDPRTHGADVLARIKADDAKVQKFDDETAGEFGDG